MPSPNVREWIPSRIVVNGSRCFLVTSRLTMALMALLFFAMFIAAGFIVGGISYGTTAFGVRDSAFLAGLSSGAWSALVAIVTPLTGRLFDRQLYAEAFLIAALLPAVGFLAHRACYSK